MRVAQGSASPKINRPRLHGVVQRQRLFDLLASATAPAVWIAAPPGGGKTTLAASFAEHRNTPLLWVQVDAGDSDPASFFNWLRQAAMASGLGRAARLPSPPGDLQADPGAFARHWFRSYFALLRPDTLLVFDNVQEAEPTHFEPLLHEAIEQLPAHLKLLVLSLSEPGPLFARQVANGRITRVGAGPLLLTRAESDALVLSRLSADTTMLAAVHERASGWVAGVVLMIEHLRQHGSRDTPAVDDSQQAVFDFFAGQILAGCTAQEQRALMLTAGLPRLTADLAQAASAYSGMALLLDALAQRHLFVERRSVGGNVNWQYHRLFRSFLLARAETTLPQLERAQANERAAQLLQLQGDAESALMLQLAGHHWPASARLIVQLAPQLLEQGRWQTTLDWIALLPTDAKAADPWLDHWLGTCQVFAHAPQARATLTRAWDRFNLAGDRTGQILSAGAASRACMLGADWRAVDLWIERLATLLNGDMRELAPDVVLTGLTRLLYVTHARQPQHPQLPAWAERATAALGEGAEADQAVLAASALLFYFSWTGQTSRGDQLVRQIVPLAGGPAGANLVSQVYWLMALANHRLWVGERSAALSTIDEAWTLASAHGMSIAGVIRRHRIFHLLTAGQLARAESELDELSQLALVEPYLELRAWLALLRDRHALAQQEACAALAQAQARGRSFYATLDHLLLATIACVSGRGNDARLHLRDYERATAKSPGELPRFQALLVHAGLALHDGALPQCHAALHEALDIGSRQQYRSTWAWTPALLRPLLAQALEQGIQPAYATELIRRHGLLPPQPPPRHWPWPVRVHTLGRFDVETDGSVLRFARKAQRKPLELLKLLVSMGPGAVSEDRLIENLWPDPEQGGRKALEITVHRLRKLLGGDSRVTMSDRHANLNSGEVWVDAWALECLLEQAMLPPPAAVLLLFRGPFLDGEAGPPSQLATRERIASRLQRYAQARGAQWEASADWALAAELYQRMAELDPWAELFHRGLMRCLLAQGRRAEAAQAYRRCRQLLATGLGAAPGAETEALAQRCFCDP